MAAEWADCLAIMAGMNQLTAMLAAVDLQVVGELKASQATVEHAGVNTVAWLHGHCQQRLLTELPDDLTEDQVATAEETMVDFAANHAPVGLRKLAGHLLAVVTPEVTQAHEADVLAKQERGAARTQFLRWRDDGDGAKRFSGRLPAGQREQLRAVVEAIAKGQKPKPADRSTADPVEGSRENPTVDDESWAGVGSAAPSLTPDAIVGVTDSCLSIEARRRRR